MSAIKLTNQNATRSSGKIKLKRNQISVDTARLSVAEKNQKAAYDEITSFDKRVQNNEYLSAEDITRYGDAVDRYIDSSNRIRDFNGFLRGGYSADDDKSWQEYTDALRGNYNATKGFYSQFGDEKAYQSHLAGVEEYNKLQNYDLNTAKTEIDALQSDLDKLKSNYGFGDRLLAELHHIGIEQFTSDEVLDEDRAIKDLEAKIADKQAYYDRANKIQTGIRLAAVADPESENYDPEFDEKSKYRTTKATKWLDEKFSEYDMGYNDLDYEYINGDAAFRAKVNAKHTTYTKDTQSIISSKSRFDQRYYDYLKDDEIKIYNYYYAVGGKAKAQEYLETLEETLKARAGQSTVEAFSALAKDHPVLSSALSIATSLESGIEYVGDAIKYGLDIAFDGSAKMDTNTMSLTTNAIRGTVSEQVDWEIGNWDAFDFLYNTTMSGLDSLVAGVTLGPYANIALGLSAAAQGTQDALDRGMSDNKAFWNGLFSGAFEMFFEKFSIGEFERLKEIAPESVKDIIKNLGKTMLVNCTEEMATEIANIAYDTLINGELANYTWDELKSGAWKDAVFQVVEAGASGALMGLGMGGVGTAYSVPNMIRQNQQVKYVYGDDQLELVSEGLESAVGSESHDLAVKYQALLEKGKNLSGGQLRRLVGANERAFAAEQAEMTGNRDLQSEDTVSESRDRSTDVSHSMNTAEQYGRMLENMEHEDQIAQNVPHSEAQDAVQGAEKAEGQTVTMQQNDAQVKPAEATEPVTTETSATITADVAKRENGTVVAPASTTVADAKADMAGNEHDEPETLETEAKSTQTIDNADAKEETLETASVKYGAQAGAMVHTYTAGQDVARYDDAYGRAYEMGKSGVSLSYAVQSAATAYLTEAQRELAWEAGKAASEATAKKRDADIRQSENGKSGRKIGAVKGDGVSIDDLKATFNDKQNTAYRLLSTYAEATGINIVLRKSEVGEDGKYQGSQGKFAWSEDTIYIDINAGLFSGSDVDDLAKYTMLRTFSHEFTHFLEKWNPVWYNEFRRVVFDTLTERGADVPDLIERKMHQDASGKMDYDAASREVVAEAMTDILPDATFVQTLAEQHKTIFGKLLERLKEFVRDLEEYFSSLVHNPSREANALKKQVGEAVHYVESIVKLFDRVAIEAVENYQRAVATDAQIHNETNGGTADGTEQSEQSTDEQAVADRAGARGDAGALPEVGNGRGVSQEGGDLSKEASDIRGRRRELSQREKRFPEDSFIVPKAGSVEAEAIDTLTQYNIEAYVVKKSAWDKKAPATSKDGRVYIKEGIDEFYRGLVAPHEATHVMKQLRFQPYVDFIMRTPDMLNMADEYAQYIMEATAKHRKIDVFHMNELQQFGLYDEINATVYGHYAAGHVESDFKEDFDSAFHDFDAYIRELDAIHERFKVENAAGDDHFTVTDNQEFGTLEIKFDGKPSESVRDVLKSHRFRWHGKRGIWYGKADRTDIVRALREAYQAEASVKEENRNVETTDNTGAVHDAVPDGQGDPRVLDEVEARDVPRDAPRGNAVADAVERGSQARRDGDLANAAGAGRGSGQGDRESGDLRRDDGLTSDEEADSEHQTPPSPLHDEVAEQIEQQSTESPKGHNFVIGDTLNLPSGDKARYKINVAAIRLVKKLEAEGRHATDFEQTILSKYVGWGGLANAFDEKKADWSREYAELRELLTDEEYSLARGSTLNAHYTDISVIKAMYDGLARLGFTGGRMLEPSAGIGHFIGAMPTEMSETVKSWTAVELDGITGLIAKHLYPNADVRIQGFEKANIPNDFMDVAISNVPFGNYAIADKAYPKKVTSAIHNYFFAKALDKVRPGGIVMFITSSYTMNAKDSTVRRYIMQRADLLGAIRLPDNAFKSNAGTDVVTDILILKKRAPGTDYAGVDFLEAPWVYPVEGNYSGAYINTYFNEHPEMVLGTPTMTGSMYHGAQLTYKALEGKGSLADQIRKAFEHIDGKMDYPVHPTPEHTNFAVERALKQPKQNSLRVRDGKVYQEIDGQLVEQKVNEKTAARIAGLLEIRDAARDLKNYQQQGVKDSEIKKARKRLNDLYDAFVKKHGYINSPANKGAFMSDPDRYSVFALENYDPDTKRATKSDIFTKNTVSPNRTVSMARDVSEGLIVSVNQTGGVDTALIAKLTGKTVDAVTRELIDSRLAFKDRNGRLQSAEVYLSGNVRAKLREAEAMAPLDADYQNNVDALKAVMPADVGYQDIFVNPGTPWIPNSVYSDFAAYMLGSRNSEWRQAVDVTRNPETGNFTVELKERYLKTSAANTQKWGTPRRSFLELFDAMLNSRSVVVKYKLEDGSTVVDKDATAAANEKMENISKEFGEWLWRDEGRRDELTTLYNEVFNSIVTPKYNGEHLTVNGANADKPLRPHQRDAVQRVIASGGNTLLAHKVGAGKTYEMAAAAMKLRELGLVKKPMFAVPKSLVAQWGNEFMDFFPTAKLLVAEASDFTATNRKVFMNRIANGDYDAVIVSYEQFERLPISADFARELYEEQISSIIRAIEEAKADKGEKSLSIKDLEKKRKALQTKIDKLTDAAKDENNIDFEQLGVDSLFIDEAHNFKNLFYTTSMTNVAGLGNKDGSKRAFDLYTKVRYLQKLNGGRGIVFATATPVMNSMSEMYIMQKYLQPDLLDRLGLSTFDAWAKQFGEVVNGVEIKPSGQGYRVKQSFSRFKNMSELQLLFRNFADVLTDIPGLKIPKMKGGAVNVVVCDPGQFQQDYMKELEKRADKVKSVDPSVDNMLKITSDGRKISYTQRMIDPTLPYEEGCKIYRCADNVVRVYQESQGIKGTQLIFCDMATPKGKSKSAAAEVEDTDTDMESARLYDDIKVRLIEGGIPAKQIAFIHEADTDQKKKKLFADVNDGKVRVLIGSTGKMGVGMNAQKRVVAIHHLDAPWRPGDVEQRNGRAYRQGNINEEVECFTYVTEGSFDARLWDILERKQNFINQIMNGENVGREAEDTGEVTLSAAEVKALASGSPLIMEQVQLDTDIKKLESLYRAHTSAVRAARERLAKDTGDTSILEKRIAAGRADVTATVDTYSDGKFSMTVGKSAYTEKKDAGVALMAAMTAKAQPDTYTTVGKFAGFELRAIKTSEGIKGLLVGKQGYPFNTYPNNTTFMVNHLIATIEGIGEKVQEWERLLGETHKDIAEQEALVAAPFAKQAELDAKRARYTEVMDILNPKEEQQMLDGSDEDIVQEQSREYLNDYNNQGEKNDGKNSQDAEVLDERTLSADGRGRNSVWQQGEDPETVYQRLADCQKGKRLHAVARAGSSGWLEGRESAQGKQPDILRFGVGILRNVRGRSVSPTDTAGRDVTLHLQKAFADTIFKDDAGRLLSLYHWTDTAFHVFANGDIGFHFGTLDAAHKRYQKVKDDRIVNKSFYKEVYLNITNPATVDFDPMTWDVFPTAYKLNEANIISDFELERLSKLDGFIRSSYDSPAAVELRRMLMDKGIDGIIYRNDFEGALSAIALTAEQIYTVAENGTDVVYDQEQQRMQTFSDREVLALAADTIQVDELSDGERDALRIFNERLAKLEALEIERSEAGKKYKEQQFGAKVDREAAAKTLNRMHVLDEQIQRANADILSIEDKKVLREVLQKARRVVELKTREHDYEVFNRWRDRRNNAALIKKYQGRIKKDVKELSDWILHPSNKDAIKRVPDALKQSVIPFLSSIDFTSKRALGGGDTTLADREFFKRLNGLKSALRENMDVYGMYSGYNDLPPDFMDKLQTLIDETNALVENSNGEFVVNQMTSEEMRDLSHIVRTLKKFIMDVNRFHVNAMYQHVYEAGDSTVQTLDVMKDAGSNTGGVSNFVLWQQIRPAYAFERFGEGGMSIYDGLRRGQATLAFNTKQIKEFAEKTYTAAEVLAWEKEIKSIRLGGDTVKIPVSAIMSFYELSKRPQALGHILGNGIRVATYKNGRQKISDVGHIITMEDVQTLTGTLTDRQRAVADALQQYMAEQGAVWGNHVTVKRFGEELFGEKEYFPIHSDGRHLQANADEQPSAASLYALLNMSFTKELTENASNRIILYSIFDVFSNHMASMAQYNALALPVLDALKWFNYKKVEFDADGKSVRMGSVREHMDRVYGVPEETRPGSGRQGYAQTFVINILKAFNGTEAQGVPTDAMGINFNRRYNMAQVAYNFRVVLQQPLAITRAGLLLDYTSILKGMRLSPAAIKHNIEEMQKYSGIAAWKSLGFYDVNISRGLSDIIKHKSTVVDKIDTVGMWGAEKADTLTWAGMWSAAKEQVMKKQGIKPTDNGFYDAVTALFEDVIYKTQVVDSVLTKNEFLRSKGAFARLVGSFMSEPTATASMLIDAFDKYHADMQRGMNRAQAWSNNKRMIGRVAYVYGLSAVMLAAVQAVADGWRDDDEYETFLEKWLEAFGGNLIDEAMPLNKLPILSDFYDLAKSLLAAVGVDTYGNPPQSVFMQWYDSLVKGVEILHDKIVGEDTNYTYYGSIYKLLQAVSGMTGLPMASATREIITAWNNTVGAMAPSLKVVTYDAGDRANIKYAYLDGYLTDKEAMHELLAQELVDSMGEAYYTVREWDESK